VYIYIGLILTFEDDLELIHYCLFTLSGQDSSTEKTLDRLLSLLLVELDGVAQSDAPPLVLLGSTHLFLW